MATKSRMLIYTKFLLASAFFLVILAANLLTGALTAQNFDGSPAWSNPSVMTMRNIGLAPTAIDRPNYQSNLDCQQITYRRVSYNDMESGCFVTTAYGLVDPDSEMVIYNGTDEALPIVPFLPHQVLTPSPNSNDTLTLDPASTEGSYLGIYRNLLSGIKDERNFLGELVAKDVTFAQDINLNNTDGSRLVINPQTMAFSSDGRWLVVETLGGSFVRIDLPSLETIAFTKSFHTSGSPGLLKSHVAVSPNGRYVAIENVAASSFKVYDLSTCQGDHTSINSLVCENYDYWPFVNAKFSGISVINHLRFINDGIISFRATFQGEIDSFELAPTYEITSLIDYLALGDSYTSGEGAFDYLSGTDNDNNHCHLSVHSYPLLIAQQLFGNSSGHSVACSGGKIGDILPSNPNKYRGQVKDGTALSQRSDVEKSQTIASFMPGFLPQSEFVSQYLPKVMTVSIGGNDIGFADTLVNCVMPHLSPHLSDGVCYNTYEDRLEFQNLIDRTVNRWVSLFRNLKSKSPLSSIYVIGYPQIADDTGNCALNVQLSKSELEFFMEITDYINQDIQKSALLAGVNFVDISKALYGYRLCETASYNVAVNGLTAGKDSGLLGLKILGSESYHPNAFGQSLIAKYILKQTNNLKASVTIGSTVNAGISVLNPPKSDRQIQTLIPVSGMTKQVIAKGTTNTLTIDGAANGLKPKTSYSITIDRGKSQVIGSTITDYNGDISTSYVLPIITTTGGHTIDIVGVNQAGETVDLTQPIYVVLSDADADGDDINDANDSCPLAVNSGVDSDQDGIDDICDGYIGPTVSSTINGTGSNPSLTVVGGLISAGDIPSNNQPTSQNLESKPLTMTKTNTKNPIYSYSNPLYGPTKTDSRSAKTAVYRHLTFRNWLGSTWRLSKILLIILMMVLVIKWFWEKFQSRYRRPYIVGNRTRQEMPMSF